MLVPVTWDRALLAAALFLGAVSGVAQSNNQVQLVQPMTIFGQFKDRSVMLTATRRSAGAIESLQWGGMEFLDASDHGRHLQSAVSYDALGECDNPTEAGASKDGSPPNFSSSGLQSWSVAGNVLRTSSRMAYWIRKGQRSEECRQAINDGAQSPVSSTVLEKAVRFLPGFANVLEHTIVFDLARPRRIAQFEVLTAYMPERFGTFYRFDAARAAMEPLSDGPGEQELPVVLATSDGSHALAVMTLETAAPGLNGPRYGRWRFKDARVTKSNVVFRQENAKAGPHRFRVYSVFGTLEDVRSTLGRLYENGPSTMAAAGSEPFGSDPQGSALARN